MTHQFFSIFKNKFKKEGTTQPDYKISAKDEKGNFVEIGAGWIKDMKEGGKYISCKLSDNPYPTKPETVPPSNDKQLDDF